MMFKPKERFISRQRLDEIARKLRYSVIEHCDTGERTITIYDNGRAASVTLSKSHTEYLAKLLSP